MPVVGPRLSAEVRVVGGQALVKLVNRSGSRATFVLPAERVRVDGNTVGAAVVPHVEGFRVTLADGSNVDTTFV